MKKAALQAFMQKHRLGVLAIISQQNIPEAALIGIAISADLEVIFDTDILQENT